MNSKISFPKLIKEDMGQRLWLILFVCIIAAIAYPVAYYTSIQDIYNTMSDVSQYADENMLKEEATFVARILMGGESVFSYCFFTASAIISAIVGFSYLHSKEKTDFYHSFAVSRGTMYGAKIISGILTVMGPIAAAILVTIFIIAPITGTYEYSKEVIGSLPVFISLFLGVYGFSIVAMMLTGRIITGILMSALLIFYVPLIYFLQKRIMTLFFSSLIDVGGGRWAYYGSPLSAALIWGTGSANSLLGMIVLFIYIAAGIIAGLLLYKVRPSEAAGVSMTWNILKSIIKVAAGVPIAIGAGMLFMDTISSTWYIIGAIAAALIINIIIEFIYSSDIRNIFKHWGSACVLIAVTAFILIVTAADVFGINKWHPNQNQVSRMSFDGDFIWTDIGNFYSDKTELKKRLEDGMLEDFDAIYELTDDDLEQVDRHIVYIGYEMKDKSTHYRRMSVSQSNFKKALSRLSASEEFRQKYYPTSFFDFSEFDTIQLGYFDISSDDEIMYTKKMNQNDMELLCEAIKEDSLKKGLDEFDKEPLLCAVRFMKRDAGDDDDTDPVITYTSNPLYITGKEATSDFSYAEVYVYSDYEKTIELLNNLFGVNVLEISN